MTRKESIAKLKEATAAIHAEWLKLLLNMWGLEDRGHRITMGAVYDYDGAWTLSMEDIIFCVEHGIDIKRMLEWQDYLCFAAEFDFDLPRLDEWINGCPRISKEKQEQLEKMKRGLLDLCEEEKKKLRKEGSR